MVKINENDIIKILQKAQKPLGPTEIAEELNLKKTDKTIVHYHLKNLQNDGRIVNEGGNYSLKKDELKILEEIENKVINLLSTEELGPNDLQQKLGFDESKIFSALYQLEGDGLIKEGSTSITKRGGFVKTGRTTNDSKYCRETKYTLTHLGYSKIGVCPICKKEIKQEGLILTAFFRTNYSFKPQSWKNVLIHLDCIPDSEAYDIVFGKYEGPIFCKYCGLPLSPKMIPKRSITYKSIKCHFSELELETIWLFERLILSCTIRSNFIPVTVSKDKYVIDLGTLNDSTIQKAYKNSDIEIPDWVSKRLKNESPPKESSSENDNIEPLSWEISTDFLSLEADLSELSSAENFIKVLKKYRSDFPADYDIDSRIKEIWASAQNIKNKNEENIQRMYEKLLGPAGSIYIYIGEAFGTEQYDFDRQKSDAPYDESSIFSQTIAFKHGDKFYHPFCAEKLGLKDDSYCNNINSKGGEG